jgi:hypothetical protein
LETRKPEELCSAVCILIRVQAGPPKPQGSIPARGGEHISSSLYKDWLWDAIGLFCNSYWGISKVKALTTHFHLVSIVKTDWSYTSLRWTGLVVSYSTGHHWSQEVKGDIRGCDMADDYKNFEWK